MKIIEKRTLRMGEWLITKLYARTDNLEICRLQVVAWEVRKLNEPESAKRTFLTYHDVLNCIGKKPKEKN